jgi:hypothetical protein
MARLTTTVTPVLVSRAGVRDTTRVVRVLDNVRLDGVLPVPVSHVRVARVPNGRRVVILRGVPRHARRTVVALGLVGVLDVVVAHLLTHVDLLEKTGLVRVVSSYSNSLAGFIRRATNGVMPSQTDQTLRDHPTFNP